MAFNEFSNKLVQINEGEHDVDNHETPSSLFSKCLFAHSEHLCFVDAPSEFASTRQEDESSDRSKTNQLQHPVKLDDKRGDSVDVVQLFPNKHDR